MFHTDLCHTATCHTATARSGQAQVIENISAKFLSTVSPTVLHFRKVWKNFLSHDVGSKKHIQHSQQNNNHSHHLF